MQLGLVDEDALGELGAEEEVLLDRQVGHEAELLEYGADAALPRVVDGAELDGRPAQEDVAGVGAERASDDVDERGLARTILAEQDVDLSGSQIEVDAVERLYTGEPLAHPAQAEEGRGPRGGVPGPPSLPLLRRPPRAPNQAQRRILVPRRGRRFLGGEVVVCGAGPV